MKVNNLDYRTIWLDESNERVVRIINQLVLPHEFEIIELATAEDAGVAILEMQVRGAGLIGATAGFGMYLASLQAGNETFDQDVRRQNPGRKKNDRESRSTSHC